MDVVSIHFLDTAGLRHIVDFIGFAFAGLPFAITNICRQDTFSILPLQVPCIMSVFTCERLPNFDRVCVTTGSIPLLVHQTSDTLTV